MIKKFTCGFCKKKNIPFVSSRRGLRKHLRQEHIRTDSPTNSTYKKGEGYIKQDWWLEGVF